MDEQKSEIVAFVGEQRGQGRAIRETVTTLGVPRANYYRWKKGPSLQAEGRPIRLTDLTPEEKAHIDRVKREQPHLRHRRIQGVLQALGVYLSATAIYRHLKERGQVEPYERRPSPLKEPLYEVFRRNLVWGADWTKLRIHGIRWYLLTLIDFFSRLLLAWDLIPSVRGDHVKDLYRRGLKSQGISLSAMDKPDLRVDQGSANTSWVTKEFFELMAAELSFARVRRPTDNAITERFYGSIKQEKSKSSTWPVARI